MAHDSGRMDRIRYTVILILLALTAEAQTGYTTSPVYQKHVSSYKTSGDSTLLFEIRQPTVIDKIIVLIDTAWLKNDSLKIGERGTSMVRPGNIWQSDSIGRGQDTTRRGVWTLTFGVRQNMVRRDLYLYHPSSGSSKRGAITVIIYAQDISGDTAASNRSIPLIDSTWADVNRSGFMNQTETTLAFDSTTYGFTLGDAGSGWSYYRGGVKYRINGDKIAKLTGTPPAAGKYYIFIDSTNGGLTVSNTPWNLQDQKIPVAMITYNDTLYPKYLLSEERHSVLIDRRVHLYEHTTSGTQLVSGGGLGDYSIAPITPTDTSNCFSIAQTVIADEDLYQTLSALSDPNGTADAYMILYRASASTWAWRKSPVPYIFSGTYIRYDLNGVMTTGIQDRFYNYYVLAANTKDMARFFMVPGRGTYLSVAAAQLEDPTTFDWTGYPVAESRILWQVTFETNAAYATKGRCRIAAAPKRISSNVSIAASGSSISHNSLSGLQGGAVGEYYHLTSGELTAVKDTVQMLKRSIDSLRARIVTLEGMASYGGMTTIGDGDSTTIEIGGITTEWGALVSLYDNPSGTATFEVPIHAAIWTDGILTVYGKKTLIVYYRVYKP